MPDIAMCDNQTCPSRESCYRFKAIPNTHSQSYMNFNPGKNKKCKDYMKIIKNEKRR